MAQVCFEEICSEWKSFEEIVGAGFSADNTYEIQNRGTWLILALESNTTPTQDNLAGRIIREYEVYTYKKRGQTLYLRTIYNECLINVAGEEEMTEYAPNLIKRVITENGRYLASDEGADGYYDITVDVPIPQISGQIKITNLNEVDVSQYETAQITDENISPENIKKDVPILGVVGTYEAEETKIRATNTSSYKRLAGEKVWVKPVMSDWHIIDFADADSDTITGALLEDIDVNYRGEVKVMLDGKKTAHLHIPDFSDDGTPRPVINFDDKTVAFSNMNQSLWKTVNAIPEPQNIVEIVVRVKSSGTGEREYQGTGAYFFRGYTSEYELTPLFRVYCGNGVSISYNGVEFGGINGHYDIVSSEDFVPNKWYWAKIIIEDATMTFYLSNDGENYDKIYEQTFPNSIFEQINSTRKEFGFLPCKTGSLVDGEYHLSESYVKIDDFYVFQPMRPVEESY